MNQSVPSGLAKKLALIMSEVGKVAKSGYNAFHKYEYVTENDLVYAVRQKLADAQIFVFTSVESQSVQVIEHEGKQSILTQVSVRHTFVDGDTGEQFSVLSQGQGSDVGDKGGYKAITGAMKYFLYKCFMIPTGDDPEADGKTDERTQGGSGRVGRTLTPAGRIEPSASKTVTVPRDTKGAYKLPDGVKWGDVAVHFGKNKGVLLSKLEDKSIGWYLNSWDPLAFSKGGELSAQDKMLLAAVNAWADEDDQRRGRFAGGRD